MLFLFCGFIFGKPFLKKARWFWKPTWGLSAWYPVELAGCMVGREGRSGVASLSVTGFMRWWLLSPFCVRAEEMLRRSWAASGNRAPGGKTVLSGFDRDEAREKGLHVRQAGVVCRGAPCSRLVPVQVGLQVTECAPRHTHTVLYSEPRPFPLVSRAQKEE